MKLLLPELDYENGFSGGNDLFERRKLGLQLQSIIRNSEDDSLVLALDDQWGNGKTTFLKMWENELLKDKEFDVIYFDAFKNDYQDDAFLALSSAIYPHIDNSDDKKNYINAAKEVGKFIVKSSVKIGLRAATLGLVKDTDFEGTADAIKESLEEPIEKIIEEKLKSAKNEVEIIEHFKHTITASARDKKIIFIVDELDRARPDFSLDLLEKIKHVFNTKQLFFVLAINKEQFKQTIKKRYGEIDSETYLTKFIHFWLALPQPKDHDGESTTVTLFIDYLSKTLKIDKQYNTSVKVLSKILEANNSSLRDCERCYSLLMLINSSGGPTKEAYQFAAAILVFLKIKRPSIFKDLALRNVDANTIFGSINIDKIKNLSTDYIKAIIISDIFSDEELLRVEGQGQRVLRGDFQDRIQALRAVLPYFESIII